MNMPLKPLDVGVTSPRDTAANLRAVDPHHLCEVPGRLAEPWIKLNPAIGQLN